MPKVNVAELEASLGDDEEVLDDQSLYEAPPEGVEALGMGVEETVQAALNGTLTPEYARKYYENKSLKPKHLKMIRLAMAGYSNRYIAAKTGYTEARVSIILATQDARAVMARIAGEAANHLGTRERLLAVAPEMLEHVIGVTRTTTDNRLRSKNAFELLDRAGYGVTKQIEIADKSRPALPVAIVSRLVSALEESNALRSTAYDPNRRKLSAAAQDMIVGEVVEVSVVDPSSATVADGSASQRSVPPGSGLQPALAEVAA
jgi:hypothetical protein